MTDKLGAYVDHDLDDSTILLELAGNQTCLGEKIQSKLNLNLILDLEFLSSLQKKSYRFFIQNVKNYACKAIQ